MYTTENFPSKAALKRAVAAGEQVRTFQPGGMFPPKTEGKIALEGPWYPAAHSWYASARVVGGVIVPGSIRGRRNPGRGRIQSGAETVTPRFINRESDGHTYWHTVDGWKGTATNLDGTPDLDNWSFVADYEEHMTPGDYAELTAWLRTKVCEGGDGCGAPPSVRPYSVTIANKDHTVHYCDDCAHLVRVGWLPDVKLIEGLNREGA